MNADTEKRSATREGIKIRRYDAECDRSMWDEMVEKSCNSTFLFYRGYMDYHSDRFCDHSLIAERGGRVVALLPANETREERGVILHSHAGLTYGGWIKCPKYGDVRDMLEIFGALERYCKKAGISAIDYKPLPDIYRGRPSADDRYALFRAGATLTECNISCAINMQNNPGFDKQQRRNLKRGLSSGAEIVEMADAREFHALLTSCLKERHGVKPVHTLEELELLKRRFPENIRIFAAVRDGRAHAGVCIFDTGIVAHAQYICSDEEGRAEGMLTMLFHRLINDIFASRAYFDFGISNEEHGRYLNEGLCRQKSSLGGSGVVYERYFISYDKQR